MVVDIRPHRPHLSHMICVRVHEREQEQECKSIFEIYSKLKFTRVMIENGSTVRRLRAKWFKGSLTYSDTKR